MRRARTDELLAAIRSRLDQRGEELAVQADAVARLADESAERLEAAARGGDSVRRMAMAAWARDIAQIERYNAARLRSGERPLNLTSLPRMPAAARSCPQG